MYRTTFSVYTGGSLLFLMLLIASCVVKVQVLSPGLYYALGEDTDVIEREKGKYIMIRDAEDCQLGLFDKPLPCCGCGIGWFSFLLGFLFPVMWYYATILYFGNYYRKDPRERAGLAASAIAALVCSVVVLITVLVLIT